MPTSWCLPAGLGGCRDTDLFLLRHLPGLPDCSGKLQQLQQQLLQVSIWWPHQLSTEPQELPAARLGGGGLPACWGQDETDSLFLSLSLPLVQSGPLEELGKSRM